MANIQIIFVVETNNISKTDDMYISKLIKDNYDLSSNDITYKFVHMGNKYLYKGKKVITDIRKFVNINKKGINHIIYCFDTDRIDTNIESIEFFKQVEIYCKNNDYELIWFCYDIENVFIGKSVSDDKKVSFATNYFSKNINYNKSIVKRLSTNDNEVKTNKKSNILLILNKYFKIKK